MDLGIAGRTAIVCASSAGLGRACATTLALAGVSVVVNGRHRERLEQTASELRDLTGAAVTPVVADVSTAEGRASLIAAVPQVDILVNNNGGPPRRRAEDVDREDLLSALEANMLAPIDLIQRVVGGMVDRRFGRIVNITSAAVKMPMEGLDLSSGARAGLTGFVAGLARQVAHANVTINNLLPGHFHTDRAIAGLHAAATRDGVTLEEARERRASSIPARRVGDPSEFGAICSYLCSASAGFIVGQNILIDGGAFLSVI